jgi:hypothetical protein
MQLKPWSAFTDIISYSLDTSRTCVQRVGDPRRLLATALLQMVLHEHCSVLVAAA